MFTRTYASSRVKRNSFYRKSDVFVDFRRPYWCTDMASPIQSSTKVHETFRQITQKLWATKTWNVDKLFIMILVFYNISFSWFLPLDGFQFNFLLRDSENVLLLWEHFKVVVTYMSTLTTLLCKPSFDSHVFQDLLFSYKKRFISIFHVLNYSIIFSQIYYRLFIEWFEKIWEEKTWILKNDQMADAWFNILWC